MGADRRDLFQRYIEGSVPAGWWDEERRLRTILSVHRPLLTALGDETCAECGAAWPCDASFAARVAVDRGEKPEE